MLLKKISFLFLVFCIIENDALKKDKLLVQIKNGLVQGRLDKTVDSNLAYYAFQGIPYAEPPTGSRRFEPPVPKKNWKGTLNATQDGPVCVQSNPPIGSEDCLSINVFVPEVSKFKRGLLPTMVFIYGGGFEAGFATYDLYAPDYLLEKEVVVVHFNYRLGIWGFLSTGDNVVPGNNGLKDQVLALKWVQENIEKFGGDPNSVTIFGQSAGSASVSYLVQSKLTKGLFHKAIMESGVSLSSWAFARRVPEVAKQIAKELSVDTSNSQKMIDGLRKIDPMVLQAKSASVVVFQYLTNDPRHGFMFAPVIEPEHPNAFLTMKSHQLMSNGLFNKIPCIIGYNSLEGTFNFGTLFKVFFLKYDFNNKKLLPLDSKIPESKQSEAAKYIKDYYFGKHLIAFSDRNLMKFLSDDQFARPVREFARLLSKHVPVYFYKFSYEGNLWGFINRTEHGVAHSEELGYIWRSKFSPSSSDITTRKRMTSMWTDFAKTGNPTPKKYFTTSDVIWKQTDSNRTYLEIDRELKLKQFPEKGEMELWDQIYQAYGRPPYDTY